MQPPPLTPTTSRASAWIEVTGTPGGSGVSACARRLRAAPRPTSRTRWRPRASTDTASVVFMPPRPYPSPSLGRLCRARPDGGSELTRTRAGALASSAPAACGGTAAGEICTKGRTWAGPGATTLITTIRPATSGSRGRSVHPPGPRPRRSRPVGDPRARRAGSSPGSGDAGRQAAARRRRLSSAPRSRNAGDGGTQPSCSARPRSSRLARCSTTSPSRKR